MARVLPDDFHWDVELQGVGQENGQGNHELHRLGQPAGGKLIQFQVKGLLFRFHLHFIERQIQGNTAFGFVAELQVSQEADQRIERDDETHTKVQHAGASDEVRRGLHVVLQRHNYTDALQGEDHCSEEHRQLVRLSHGGSGIERWQVLQDVIHGNSHADADADVGDDREGRQVLEVPDQIDENEREE